MKDLNYWKNNCEEDYINTPISVLRYITELEKVNCFTELPTSTQLLSDCKKRFKELEGKGNLDYRSYRNGYLDSFSKNVVSKIK
tara:strand:+ start:687 stop:938 length:252 start_codon:yes stop_codon:yes gene_type:complete